MTSPMSSDGAKGIFFDGLVNLSVIALPAAIPIVGSSPYTTAPGAASLACSGSSARASAEKSS
jgi:hypothetical protein